MQAFIKNKFHFLKALAAVLFHGYPARKIKVVGVTGTDGKTTTSTMIYHLLKKAGKKPALVSTVTAYIGEKEISTGLHVTSPNPWFLQRFIKKAVDKGCKYLILEATSHGLDQHRLLGTNISVAVLTNITHEHLDYHKTYSKYFQAKAKLFKKARVAILNRRDSSYKKMKKLLRLETKLIAYDEKTLKGNIKKAVEERFPEPYNLLNATAAVVAVQELGVSKADLIIKAIKSFSGVKGRMEEIKNKKGIKIIIDFAHTPEALKRVLSYLRKNKKKNKKLISIFGCAGERDVGKRAMMGKISGELADVSVFTAEDPRYEDVNEIIKQMVKGARKAKATEYRLADLPAKKHYFVRIPKRGEAIAFAIQKLAKKGDVVVICGKGHEKSMAYSGVEYPWTDQEATRVALQGEVKDIRAFKYDIF